MREASGGGSDEEGNVGGIGDGAVGDVGGGGDGVGRVKVVKGEAVEVVDGLVVEVGEMVEEAVVVGDMGRIKLHH